MHKGHQVGHAVVFGAKLAFGVGKAGDTPIQAIQNHRHENRDGGRFETAMHGGHNSVEAGKQGGRGEQIRQQVYTPAAFRIVGLFSHGTARATLK